MNLEFLRDIPLETQALVCQMLEKNFNTPYTSSAGRLFDAVSALLNIKTVATREAEAAVALEKVALSFSGPVIPYSFDMEKKDDMVVVSFDGMFKEIVQDLRRKKDRPEIALRFHKTMARAIAEVCQRLRKKYAIDNVFCAGGVFMNNCLTQEVRRLLQKNKSAVFFAQRPLTTDLGISQGQIAASVMEKSIFQR